MRHFNWFWNYCLNAKNPNRPKIGFMLFTQNIFFYDPDLLLREWEESTEERQREKWRSRVSMLITAYFCFHPQALKRSPSSDCQRRVYPDAADVCKTTHVRASEGALVFRNTPLPQPSCPRLPVTSSRSLLTILHITYFSNVQPNVLSKIKRWQKNNTSL